MKGDKKHHASQAECVVYLRLARSLPAAKILAKRDGLRATDSLWIDAFAELMIEKVMGGRAG